MTEQRFIERLSAAAIAAYGRDITPVDQIARRGRSLRRRHRAGALTGVAVATAALIGGYLSIPAGPVPDALVSLPATATEGTDRERPAVPSRAVGTTDPATQSRLIEAGVCPQAEGLSTRTFVGGGDAAHRPVVLISTVRHGTEAATWYSTQGGGKGPGLRAPSGVAEVDRTPEGDLQVVERTPDAPSASKAEATLTESPGICYVERWERSTTQTDADLDVLWGDAAWYWLVDMRQRRAATQLEVMDGVESVRFVSSDHEGVMIPVTSGRHTVFVVVSSQRGSLPSVSAMRTSLVIYPQ